MVDRIRHPAPGSNQADGAQPASAIKHCILGARAVSGKGQ
jgi:hypothetical protein